MDFLWHAVDEKEKEKIKREAKQIMDSFSKELSKAKAIKKIPEPVVERAEGEREEGDGSCDENFSRDIMFENFRIKDSDSDRESKETKDSRHAPQKNKDFIIGEKKSW